MAPSSNLPVGVEPEATSTIIVKFQEGIDLREAFTVHAPYELPENFQKYAAVACDLYRPADEYVPDGLENFWTLLATFNVKLVFLYSATPPSMLLGLLQKAQQRRAAADSGYGQSYNIAPAIHSANLFTYFKLECSVKEADTLEDMLQQFTSAYNPKNPLLELAYQRGTFVPADGEPASTTGPTDYIKILNLTGTPQVTRNERVGLHIVDQGWLTHRAFPNRGRLDIRFASPTPAPHGFQQHGCWVLGVLIAQGVPFKATAPQAIVTLYSTYAGSSSTTRIDDALVWAMDAATPNDVLLLELALSKLSKYDRHFGNNQSEFPVETDQACYDLIWLATHELGITVVEPAGNSSIDLNQLDALSFARQRTNERVAVTVGDAAVAATALPPGGLLAEGDVQHRPRYLVNQPRPAGHADTETDSGAIMVGAAIRSTGPTPIGWENGRNYGSRVDCLVPGEQLLTTDDGNGQTQAFGQTSGASALMAGLLVQIQQVARQKGRVLTPDILRQVIRQQCGVNATPVSQATIVRSSTGLVIPLPAVFFPNFKTLSAQLLP